jgi:hypothetical protein
MSGANASPLNTHDAVRVRRIDAFVGRRAGIEEQHSIATRAKRQMRMPVEHRIDILSRKCSERAVDRHTPWGRVTVHDANLHRAYFDQQAVPQLVAQRLSVVISRDGEYRSDLFQQVDRNAFREIAAVQYGLHLRLEQAAHQGRRERRSKTGQVRIGDDTEYDLAIQRRVVRDSS